MAVSTGFGLALASRLPRERLLDRRALILVATFALGTVILRLPSFFEPPWHTDEGIFEAVAQRVATGGQLYADAWESKPPLFIYTYVAIIELFGAGVLPLRIASALAALITELALFYIALRFMGRRQAVTAAGLLAVCLAVPFWEGNLALTETFAQVPATLAVLCALKGLESKAGRSDGWLLASGALFGAAVLTRQTTGLVAVALVLWLPLSGREWFWPALRLAAGGAAVVLPVLLAFAFFGSWRWFWDANVGFFFAYVPSGEQLPFHYRPLIVLPVIVTVAALAVYRSRGETPRWGLPALWLTLTLAGALLTGRPYSHYFLQVFPPLVVLAVLIASAIRPAYRPAWSQAPAWAVAAALTALWLGVVRPEFAGNVLAMSLTESQREYYANFASYALGQKSREDYELAFDKRVLLTERLETTLERLGARGQGVYVWGEYPWVYPLAGSRPATPYMTSFYTLLIPHLDGKLHATLTTADPRFVVVLNDVWPRYYDQTGVLQRRYVASSRAINRLLAERYVLVASLGRARIYERTLERAIVAPRDASEPLLAAPEDSPQEEDMPEAEVQLRSRE